MCDHDEKLVKRIIDEMLQHEAARYVGDSQARADLADFLFPYFWRAYLMGRELGKFEGSTAYFFAVSQQAGRAQPAAKGVKGNG